MTLQHPTLLWLVIPVTLLTLAACLSSSRGARSQGWPYATIRLLMALCIVVGLAAPVSTKQRPLEALTAILDISGSITEQQGDQLLKHALILADTLGVPLSVVPFAGSTVPRAVRVSPRDSFSNIRTAWQRLNTGSTNIASAVNGQAASAAPFSLLLSDGYETAGSVHEALEQRLSHPVFPLSSTGEDSTTVLSISHLHAPHTVQAQRSAEIRVTFSNHGDTSRVADVEIRHGESVVLTRAVTINPGTDLALTAQSDPSIEGLQPIQARLSWRDSEGQHSVTRTTWISAEKRQKVLLISGSTEDDRFLSQILKSQAYQLRSVVVGAKEDRLETLVAHDYEAIVLNNIHASRIPVPIATALRGYVRGGGGLIVVGGGSSYGLGGYIGSPIEELLPVKLLPPQPERKRVTVAIQLVVDKSRSMATDSRLEFAKSAAAEVVRNLKDDDYIGLIGFDDVPFIALPISRLSQVRDSAISRISRLFPTSRTNLFPALDEARRGLAAAPAGRKHVIVLTDGKLPDPGAHYFDLIKQMRFVGITVSTVMVGNEVDDGFLAQMAQSGGGAFYQTNDPTNLPRVFLSDVKVATGDRTLREDAEQLVRPGPDSLISTAVQSYPSLRGFVQTAEVEKAQTELLVRDSEGVHPLLASWNVGEGRVIAYTSDASGRWSANWMRWERIQEFWSDLVDSSRRLDTERLSNRVEFHLRTWVEGSESVIDVALFSDIGRRSFSADVTYPDGRTQTVEFVAEKPGHFTGRLGRITAGTYKARLRLGQSQDGPEAISAMPEVAWEVDSSQFGEQPHRRPNLTLLAELARRSGGILDPTADRLQALAQKESEITSHSRKFIITALCLLLLEFLLRVVRISGVFKLKNGS